MCCKNAEVDPYWVSIQHVLSVSLELKRIWLEYEKQQKQHNNGLCGMYHPKRLDYWGQEISKSTNHLLKAAAITGLTISLSASSYGQTITDSLMIAGKVIDGEVGEGGQEQ